MDNKDGALADKLTFSAIDRARAKTPDEASKPEEAGSKKIFMDLNKFFVATKGATRGPDGQYPLGTVFVSRGDGSQGQFKLGNAFFMAKSRDGKQVGIVELELRRRVSAENGGGGPSNLTEAEGNWIVEQQKTDEAKEAWKYWFNMYGQAIESDTEAQTGFASAFRDSREKEYAYLDEASKALEGLRAVELERNEAQYAEWKARQKAEQETPTTRKQTPQS